MTIHSPPHQLTAHPMRGRRPPCRHRPSVAIHARLTSPCDPPPTHADPRPAPTPMSTTSPRGLRRRPCNSALPAALRHTSMRAAAGAGEDPSRHECGRLADDQRAFDGMPHGDVVARTAVMAARRAVATPTWSSRLSNSKEGAQGLHGGVGLGLEFTRQVHRRVPMSCGKPAAGFWVAHGSSLPGRGLQMLWGFGR